jgi:hypothetical protein
MGYCPLLFRECLKQRCEWCLEDFDGIDGCSIFIIARSIGISSKRKKAAIASYAESRNCNLCGAVFIPTLGQQRYCEKHRDAKSKKQYSRFMKAQNNTHLNSDENMEVT